MLAPNAADEEAERGREGREGGMEGERNETASPYPVTKMMRMRGEKGVREKGKEEGREGGREG